MNKYPPFERVTAGKLQQGDVLLVRDRIQDRLYEAFVAAKFPDN